MRIFHHFIFFSFLIASQLSLALEVGGNVYKSFRGPYYTFVYPEKWNVLTQTEIYGSNCVILKQKKNLDSEFELLICSEKGHPSPEKLKENGFNNVKIGKWEVIGAMDSVEGTESIFHNKKIVEGVSSCRFSDTEGMHSAGDCYKSFVTLSNSYFFIESRGHRSIDDDFQVYRLISRSLISTSPNDLVNFYKKSIPLKKQQPFQ
jgi:hypothetical protein